jgi:hypothetical protein
MSAMMTSDLVLALLAMDAYSQGFGARIPDIWSQICERPTV